LLSAFIIGALAVQGLPTQDSAALQFKGDYSLSSPVPCLRSPLPACRWTPQSPLLDLNADFTDVAALSGEDGGSVRVQLDAAAVRVEAHQTTIASVLSALAGAFNIRYRASIALDEVLNGTYAGSLGHVISRVLNGYNYVIKYESSQLDVIILGKRGERVVTATLAATPIRHGRCSCPVVWSPPFATRLSRQNRCPCGP
jgi:hypothetical protein